MQCCRAIHQSFQFNRESRKLLKICHAFNSCSTSARKGTSRINFADLGRNLKAVDVRKRCLGKIIVGLETGRKSGPFSKHRSRCRVVAGHFTGSLRFCTPPSTARLLSHFSSPAQPSNPVPRRFPASPLPCTLFCAFLPFRLPPAAFPLLFERAGGDAAARLLIRCWQLFRVLKEPAKKFWPLPAASPPAHRLNRPRGSPLSRDFTP